MKIFCSIVLWIMLWVNTYGQNPTQHLDQARPLTVGSKVSEDFWTREHLFFMDGDTVRKTLEEHRGKILMLGFWSTTCSRCMYYQPQIQSFVARHPDDLAVVMVNSVYPEQGVEFIRNYIASDRFRRMKVDSLYSVIEDQYLKKLFPHNGWPYYIWINRGGYVQTATFRNYLDTNYVTPFLDLEFKN